MTASPGVIIKQGSKIKRGPVSKAKSLLAGALGAVNFRNFSNS